MVVTGRIAVPVDSTVCVASLTDCVHRSCCCDNDEWVAVQSMMAQETVLVNKGCVHSRQPNSIREVSSYFMDV